MFSGQCYRSGVKMRWSLYLCLATVLVNNAYGQSYTWPVLSSVEELVGPANAVHCSLTNPLGVTTFNGFGRCSLVVDRVTTQHAGTWTISATVPDKVLPEEQTFTAQISYEESKPEVVTLVEQEKPIVRLSCSVASSQPATACVFRDPSGRVLQARQGVSEDRFSFLESSSSGVQSCGLQITDPLTTDLGLWRCDIETAGDIFYGHLSVLCPWAMQVPEVAAAVVSEPTLTSPFNEYKAAEGESMTMTCSVQAPIRYCYFRARNGTIFNVRRGLSSDSMEYVGAGLDAGECGIRLQSPRAGDSGRWSCHVGFLDSSLPEQRVIFDVEVQAAISTEQYRDSGLIVTGVVHRNQALDYCRFVRIDGQGFTSDNVPEGYSDLTVLSDGVCKIFISNPSILDLHPWTVVAKITGQEQEVSDSTNHTLEVPQPDDMFPPPSTWWIPFVVILSVLLIVLSIFSFKRNRTWAQDRAIYIRNSLRRTPYSDSKPPLPA